MPAVRNIRLCTKDCLCLYVCPTGATDTETGQIDPDKCLDGCRACVDACPSHAISLVPDIYPDQQSKDDRTVKALMQLAHSKSEQQRMAEGMAATSDDPETARLAGAIARSCGLMGEDLVREAGYMLPQSANVIKLLTELSDAPPYDDFPVETVKKLLDLLRQGEEPQTSKYQCLVCGYIYEGILTDDFTCPVCKQPASKFTKVG